MLSFALIIFKVIHSHYYLLNHLEKAGQERDVEVAVAVEASGDTMYNLHPVDEGGPAETHGAILRSMGSARMIYSAMFQTETECGISFDVYMKKYLMASKRLLLVRHR